MILTFAWLKISVVKTVCHFTKNAEINLTMKIFIIAVCVLFFTNLQAQTDSIAILDIDVANSCYSYNLRDRKFLNYSYDPATQTHNYSKNWDFDSDGETDSLYFIGTGGAHLYFY